MSDEDRIEELAQGAASAIGYKSGNTGDEPDKRLRIIADAIRKALKEVPLRERMAQKTLEIMERDLRDQIALRDSTTRVSLEKHRHTEECFKYAAKTAARGDGAHCIAQCADSHRQALVEISKE